MVLYYIFLYLAWNSCIKLVPHQLTVILGAGEHKGRFSGKLLSQNSGRDSVEQEFKAPDCSGEGAEDIEPPDRKWP